jgi:putative SOS response-associated peptidase YedK
MIIFQENKEKMCFTVNAKGKIAEIQRKRNLKAVENGFYTSESKVNGFNHPALPVVTNEQIDTIQFYQWGLIPAWASADKADELSNLTLNAKAETIFEKPSFKDSILTKRCLVFIDGFYEWRHEGKQKIPYYISLKDGETFAVAGIWSKWIDPQSKQQKLTFSIITTEANPLMEYVHNTKKRMPLILTKEAENKWLQNNLSKTEIIDLMKPLDEKLMKADTQVIRLF